MKYASSAWRTCSEARSTSEYTATEGMPSSRQARITRTAISPRLAIRIFLNMKTYANHNTLRKGLIVIHAAAVCAGAGLRPNRLLPYKYLQNENAPPACGREGRCPEEGGKALLILAGRLFHEAARALRRLSSLGFLGGHGLIHPLVSRLQVGYLLIGGVTFGVCLFAIKQVHVGHGIVVVRTQLQRLVEHVNTILDVGPIEILQVLADLLVLQAVIRLQPQFGALFHARLVALGPVNHTDRIVGFRVVGIYRRGLAVKLLGEIEFLHLQVEISDSLDAVDLLLAAGITAQHLLVLVNGLLRIAVVIRRVRPGNILLGVGGGQI